jgi:hypothetical protein
MKTTMQKIVKTHPYRAFIGAASSMLAIGMLLVEQPCQGAPVIDPTGAIYTGISASSSYSSGYLPNNLFAYNLTGVSTGSTLSSPEWATAGALSAYVAFQLDNSYLISSLFYAQRNSGGRSDTDQMNVANIWVSQTTPFDPNNPPATTPDATVTLDPTGTQLWTEYALSGTLTGQYFLIEFTDTDTCCNPGGAQLRLGGMLSSITAPYFTQMPQDQKLYVGSTAQFAVTASDGNTAPLSYRWNRNLVPLSDSGRFSGSATPNLTITGTISGDAGSSYTCTVTNSIGSTNSAAAVLSLVSAPADAVGSLTLSNGPTAYWRFDESAGATNAADYAGGFDAAYGADDTLANAGMQPPTFPGFYAANTCVGLTEDDPSAVIYAPALNLNTNTVTILAWINPAVQQDQYASLLVWRDGGGAAYGMLDYNLNYPAGSGELGWIWDNLGWYENTGLVIPANEWSLGAMVVTATNVTLYLGANGVITTYVSAGGMPNAGFSSSMSIGADGTSRVFNGFMDDVAIFNHALTLNQIQTIYGAGVGQVPAGISQQPVNVTNYVGGTANFSIVATGSSVTYQWRKGLTLLSNGGKISGANTANLTLANVSPADASSYSCIVSNALGALASSAASLTVIPAPTNAYDATIFSYDPEAYWKLNDPQGSPMAADYWGDYNGTVLPDATLGVAGPQSPAFPGFSSTNTALQTTVADGNSTVAVPGLNLNNNTATILMWIYPIAGGPGTFGGQVDWCSLFANRSGGYASLNYLAGGTDLSFQWDSYGWDSGIAVPSDQWELVGMAITPTMTTVYLGTNGVLTSATEQIANPALSFSGTSYIGCDSGNGTRVFNGVISDVAFFNRSLSTADVTTIYNAAIGLDPVPPTLSWSASPPGLVFTWYGPFTLMQAGSVTGPWTPSNVTSGTAIPMTASKEFYRLQH